MKYKYKQNQYKINLLYTDESPIPDSPERRLFAKIAANNKNYSALEDVTHVTSGIIHSKLVYYQHIYHGFLLSYIWIKNVIDNMDDCLLISNRLYFIEGLIVYANIKKISIIPTCITEKYEEDYNYKLAQFKEKFNKKIIIEQNVIKNMYKNIIIYISEIIYDSKNLNTNTYYYNIYWVANALKHLKKNGNLIFRLSNNMTDYILQLIYIISSYFKKVHYDTYLYKTDEPWLKYMIVFENYHNNDNNILDDILNQVKKNKMIINIIDVKYDHKYNKFIKKLMRIFDVNNSKFFKLFNKRKSIIKYISQNTIDKMYKENYMLTLDKCLTMCENNDIKVATENKMKSYKYKIEIASNILKIAEMIYYDATKIPNYKHNQEYLSIIAEYYTLKIYTKLRKRKVLKKIKQNFNINEYITDYIEKITKYDISIEFAKTFELFSIFNLIPTNSKKINILHLHNTYDENCTKAIKHYFKQTNNKIKINSKIYLDTDNLSEIINKNKNINYCYFDCNKKFPIYLLSYIITSLKILKLGCNCVFKTYISNVNFQLSYFNLLALFFEHIYIAKSNLDAFINDEIYIIAKNKKNHIDTKTYNKILNNIASNNVKLDIEPNNIIYRSLIMVIDAYINNMNMILYYYDNTNVLDTHLSHMEQYKYDFMRDWFHITKMSI
uniref:Uncharacterized protein n=1 Tax=viral metagenome TaxID=1070528 RepID=A0A6C0DXD7_9ZZZZ